MKLGVDRDHGLVSIIDGRVVPVGDVVGVPEGHTDPLLWLLAQDDRALRLAQAARETGGRDLIPASLAAPIARPPKVIAAPVNYLDHKLEMKEQSTIAQYGVFLKAPTSVIGPSGTIELPYSDMRIDQEGELGVVIGTRGRNIRQADALSHVFGYTCVLDISVRSTEDRSTRKSYDTFTPIGPWITTADEVPDPGKLDLTCSVSGELRQRASTADLIYDVALLIEYASSVMTLEVGDIIATGTPAGVGALTDGDVVRVEIESLGGFEVPVSAKNAIPYARRPGL